jgi:hypothetical protein
MFVIYVSEHGCIDYTVITMIIIIKQIIIVPPAVITCHWSGLNIVICYILISCGRDYEK